MEAFQKKVKAPGSQTACSPELSAPVEFARECATWAHSNKWFGVSVPNLKQSAIWVEVEAQAVDLPVQRFGH